MNAAKHTPRPVIELSTQRFPRTLEQAFGPHTSRHIEEKRAFDLEDRIVMWACVITVLALAVVLWR